MSVERLLRKPILAVPFVGLIFGLIIYAFPNYTEFFVITILAFLASDVISLLFIKGGRGILQIPLFGTKTQPKGYGFIAFFLSVLGTTLIVKFLTQMIFDIVSMWFVDIIRYIAFGVILAVLLYLSMNAKFYER